MMPTTLTDYIDHIGDISTTYGLYRPLMRVYRPHWRYINHLRIISTAYESLSTTLEIYQPLTDYIDHFEDISTTYQFYQPLPSVYRPLWISLIVLLLNISLKMLQVLKQRAAQIYTN
jgi:hypothetical protein